MLRQMEQHLGDAGASLDRETLLSLTLLAPDLVEAILEGRCDAGLPSLLRPFPASWHEQASTMAAGSSPTSRTDGQASSDKGQSRHEDFG